MSACSSSIWGNALCPPGCHLPTVVSVAHELFSLALVGDCWFSLAGLTSSELLATHPQRSAVISTQPQYWLWSPVTASPEGSPLIAFMKHMPGQLALNKVSWPYNDRRWLGENTLHGSVLVMADTQHLCPLKSPWNRSLDLLPHVGNSILNQRSEKTLIEYQRAISLTTSPRRMNWETHF